jgi:putative redox protein
MDATCVWKGGQSFDAVNRQHTTPMDAKPPFGKDKAATPKEMLLNAISGCTAMDVISLLRKSKEEPRTFSIEAHADLTPGQPSVFSRVHLVYRLEGELVENHVLEAVQKSMSLYCGVTAMIVKAAPVTYEIFQNGSKIGEGEARFPQV